MEEDEYNEMEIQQSMRNAYILLTNKLSFEDIFEHNGCDLPFNIKEEITDNIIEDVIEHFCEIEEFEKCAELKKLKETQKYNKNFINL